jgi:4-hydroxybenzoate polyprenyltransferase
VRELRPLPALWAWVDERFALPVSVPVAVILTGAAAPPAAWARLPAVAALGWLLLLGARAWDDLVDLPRDRIRRPGRLLPSGGIPPRLLLRTAVAAALLGLAGSLAVSTAAGVLLAACMAVRVLWEGSRMRQAPLVGTLLVDLAFPALVVLGSRALGGAPGETVLLAGFTWAGAVAHDLAHGIEDEERMPEGLRDPLPAALRARLALAWFGVSLLLAAAVTALGPDPVFGAVALAVGAGVAVRLARLLRAPDERNARRLRVAGFVYFVAPLAGSMAASVFR